MSATCAPNNIKTRLAPSPTGRMHAGNIYAALMAWLIAKSKGGSVVLRIEDIDTARSKPEFADALMHDFEALGLFWDEGPYYQHDRIEAYEQAFRTLCDKAQVYPCYCTRADFHAASAPHAGEHVVYPGTCRIADAKQQTYSTPSDTYQQTSSVPSDANKALAAYRLVVPDASVTLSDALCGTYSYNLASDIGDFVIKRKDGGFAYHLAVVVDDAEQGITTVVRGRDLLDATPAQIYIQTLLGYKTPDYVHVPLCVDSDGIRLSKRQKSTSYEEMLTHFKTPAAVLGYIAYTVGLIPDMQAVTPEDLVDDFSLEVLRTRYGGHDTIVFADA